MLESYQVLLMWTNTCFVAGSKESWAGVMEIGSQNYIEMYKQTVLRT